MNLIILISTLFFICFKSASSDLTEAQQKEILDAHNKYRALVASGKVPKQPTAANMLKMKWNSESATKAQKTANICKFSHDTVTDRKYGKFEWVGQNIALFSDSNVVKGVEMWYKENSVYIFSNNSCSLKTCGHFTQVLWADSQELGCGASNCKYLKRNVILLVCNYGPGGNFNKQSPYISGPACSKCPSGTKCTNSLCS